MDTYSKQTILNFLEQSEEYIARDIFNGKYSQKIFSEKELNDVFGDLYIYPEKAWTLFRPWLTWYRLIWHQQ